MPAPQTSEPPAALNDLFEAAAAWTDSLLVLGWSGVGVAQLTNGQELAGRLHGAGLHQCALALDALLADLADPAPPDRARRAQSVGRLCLALELSQEAWQLARLSGGETKSDPPTELP